MVVRSDAELRLEAMHMACNTQSQDDNADSIVERAQAFYEFMKDGSDAGA